jgi:hypothetical protein
VAASMVVHSNISWKENKLKPPPVLKNFQKSKIQILHYILCMEIIKGRTNEQASPVFDRSPMEKVL